MDNDTGDALDGEELREIGNVLAALRQQSGQKPAAAR